MPKAWKILFLKPGLLGLASWWPPADCPSLCSSALCTSGSELFACVRSIARVRASVRGVDESEFIRNGGARTNVQRKKEQKERRKGDSRLKHSKSLSVRATLSMHEVVSASRLTSRRHRVENGDTYLVVTLLVLAVGQTGARAAPRRSLLVAQQLRYSRLVH